jgi:hypothetical protein
VPAALGLGVMAALIQALRAYVSDIAETLSQRLIPWTDYEPWRIAQDLVKF